VINAVRIFLTRIIIMTITVSSSIDDIMYYHDTHMVSMVSDQSLLL